MKTSEKCRELFWQYRAGDVNRKEMNEELDKLEGKQKSLRFPRRPSYGEKNNE